MNKVKVLFLAFCIVQSIGAGFAAEENITSTPVVISTTEIANNSVTSPATVQTSTATAPVPAVTTKAPVQVTVPATTPDKIVTPSAPTVNDVTTVKPAVEAKSVTSEMKPEELHEMITLGPEVAVKSGKLRPSVLKSRKGREYFAFLGVPFANPPVQFQRFKVPKYSFG